MAERKLEVSSIQIEDPMDFLSVSEKEAYMRAHQNTLMRDAEEMRRIREQTEPVRSARRRRTQDLTYENLYEEEYEEPHDNAYGEEEPEEESVIDWIISVAMRAMLAAIVIVGLMMAYMMFIRPAISRSMGSNRRQEAIADTQAEENRTEERQTAIQQQEAQDTEQVSGRPQAQENGGEQVVTTTQLNLRTAPNTETSEVITSVPEGTTLSRIAENNGWSTILYEGQELYCASEYLRAE